jgi:hypothetical protein
MEEDVYSTELFRVMARVLGFAIAVIILAYMLEYLGLLPKHKLIQSMLADGSLVASIAR